MSEVEPERLLKGLYEPWKPDPYPSIRTEAIPNPPVMSAPQHIDPDAFNFNLRTPEYIVAPPLSAQPASSFTIGVFDRIKIPESAGEFGEPTKDPEQAHAQTKRSDDRGRDLIYRLAAKLQPPISMLHYSEGVLVWPAPLLPYQRDGVGMLISRAELLLADDMGLGKTIQAIAALRILYYQHEIENALVVCPASLVSQWQREFYRWAPDLQTVIVMGTSHERGILWQLPAHVKIISYDTLRGDVLDLRDSPPLRTAWSVVVLDEASRIKNRETGISVACKRISCERRWALTGTPLENRREDLFSILEFLIGDRDRDRLRAAGSDDASLRDLLSELQLRRKKEDVLHELPPKMVIEKVVDLLPAQRTSYDTAEQLGIIRLRKAGNDLSVTHVLELITRLKQICNNDPVTGQSVKLADIEERIAVLTQEGHRALVFSQFTDNQFGVQMIADRLDRFAPLVYTGAQSAAQKTRTIDLFSKDTRYKALVLSLRAGGVGLNLQSASYIFHADRWWNPAIEEQADSRAHRMGQPHPVTVFRYICAGTIEERIDAKLRAKRLLFQDMVDDVSIALPFPSTVNLTTALTEEELFGLFDLVKVR